MTGSGKQTIKLTSERTSDGSKLIVNSWVAGKLLLMDLGYYDHRLLNRIDSYNGFFLSRIKSSAMPRVVSGNALGFTERWVGQKVWDVAKRLGGAPLDVNASFSVRIRKYAGRGHTITRPFRVVAVRSAHSAEYRFYVTNISPTDLSAEEVARTYSMRWEVETIFKELKTHFRLAQVETTKAAVAESLIYASLLALAASRALLRNSLRQRTIGEERFLPTGRWASIISTIAGDLTDCVIAPRRRTSLERKLLAPPSPRSPRSETRGNA